MHDRMTVPVPCISCGTTIATPQPSWTETLFVPAPSQCVACQRCGLCFVWPQPDQTGFYEQDYYTRPDYPMVGGLEAAAPHLVKRLDVLSRCLGHQGRFLDVGCSTGALVAAAAARGWQAKGVDVSRWATQQARSHGLAVATGTLEPQHYPDATFDVVHSSHLLEHVPNPAAVLREMRRILKPDGLLSLEVPQETRSFQQAFRRWRGDRPRYPSPHLFFFTTQTLTALLRASGFQTVQVRTRNFSLAGRRPFTPGYPVTLALFALDTLTKRGPFLEVLAARMDAAFL